MTVEIDAGDGFVHPPLTAQAAHARRQRLPADRRAIVDALMHVFGMPVQGALLRGTEIRQQAVDYLVRNGSIKRQELSDALPDVQTHVAEQAYAAYDFGPGVERVGAQPWVYSLTPPEFRRDVRVRTGTRGENAIATDLTMTVRLDFDARVVHCRAVDEHGRAWGRYPDSVAAAVEPEAELEAMSP